MFLPYIISCTFLIKDLPTDQIIYKDAHKGQNKPDGRISNTDLSVQVIWHFGIVPDIPMQTYIDEITGNEF